MMQLSSLSAQPPNTKYYLLLLTPKTNNFKGTSKQHKHSLAMKSPNQPKEVLPQYDSFTLLELVHTNVCTPKNKPYANTIGIEAKPASY